MDILDLPSWQVHRGYWREGVRENTLAAFAEANKQGAEMVELDVQLSKDQVPHVFHDYNLKKFFHIDENVSRVSSDDLSALNIPTLEAVLQSEEVPAFLNIELKSIDLLPNKLSKRVAEVLQFTEHDKKVMISSFNPMCLNWFKKHLPEIPRGLLIGHREPLFSWKFPISVRLADPAAIHAGFKLVDEEDSLARLMKFKRPLIVWTVNDLEKAKAYLDQGVISIISDLAPP